MRSDLRRRRSEFRHILTLCGSILLNMLLMLLVSQVAARVADELLN